MGSSFQHIVEADCTVSRCRGTYSDILAPATGSRDADVRAGGSRRERSPSELALGQSAPRRRTRLLCRRACPSDRLVCPFCCSKGCEAHRFSSPSSGKTEKAVLAAFGEFPGRGKDIGVVALNNIQQVRRSALVPSVLSYQTLVLPGAFSGIVTGQLGTAEVDSEASLRTTGSTGKSMWRLQLILWYSEAKRQQFTASCGCRPLT